MINTFKKTSITALITVLLCLLALFLLQTEAKAEDNSSTADKTEEISGTTDNPTLTTYKVNSGNYTVILNGVTDENKEALATAILDSVNSGSQKSIKFVNENFVDAEKYSYSKNGYDSVHCWCASTSNILRISGWADDFENPVVEEKHTSYEDDLLALFTTNFTDDPNLCENGLSYYFNGILSGTTGAAKQITESSELHPITKNYSGTMPQICSQALSKKINFTDKKDYLSNLEKLENTAIEMSVEFVDTKSGETVAGGVHSMTLTGVVIDNTKTGIERYKAIMLADSDNEECADSLPESFEEACSVKLAKTNSYTLYYTSTLKDKFGFYGYHGDFAELISMTCLPFKSEEAVKNATETASNATCKKDENADLVVDFSSFYSDIERSNNVYKNTDTLHLTVSFTNRNLVAMTKENAGQSSLKNTVYVYRDGSLVGKITKGLSYDLKTPVENNSRNFQEINLSNSGLFSVPGEYTVKFELNSNGCKEVYVLNNETTEYKFKVVKDEVFNKSANAISLNKGLKVSTGTKKISVKWGKVTGADGYLVYSTYGGQKITDNVKTIKGSNNLSTSITKLNGKKLNLKRNYKVCVKAYKVVNGKKVIIGKSITTHVTGVKNKKYTNTKAIKLISSSNLSLTVGQTSKIKAKSVLANGKKKLLVCGKIKKYSYVSSDTKVATVNESGKITAKSAGKCYIYVYAMNGNTKKITVTVKSNKNQSNNNESGKQQKSTFNFGMKKFFEESYDSTDDPKFGAAIVDVKPDNFNALGFALGDSVDIKFSNGYTLTDVPYYNGYYVKTGAPVMVAYPGNDYLLITLNNKGIWDAAGLSEGDTVEITINTKGKYLATQEALGQSYSFIKRDDQTNEEFANFRALSGGNLKENFLFRGASPVDNSRGRALYVNNLLEENNVKFIMDLADSEDDIISYAAKDDFESDYAYSVYKNGNDILLSMGSNYESDVYKEKVVSGFKKMTEAGGPAYIHCMEGKDRTGFVCMLVEALAGASYDEMLSDYMITYQNYYGITKEETPEKYNAVAELYFNSFMEYLHGSSDVSELKNADFTNDARKYLEDGKMTDSEIDAFIELITKQK